MALLCYTTPHHTTLQSALLCTIICTSLQYTALHYSALHCAILIHHTAPHYAALHSIMLHYFNKRWGRWLGVHLHGNIREKYQKNGFNGSFSSEWSFLRVVSSYGGFSSGWCLWRVVFPHGSFSSGWSLLMAVSSQGGLFSWKSPQVVCPLGDFTSSGGVSWGLSLMVVSHKSGLSSG